MFSKQDTFYFGFIVGGLITPLSFYFILSWTGHMHSYMDRLYCIW